MSANSFIDWNGQSGSTYRYWFVSDPTTVGLTSNGGNYIFVKKLENGRFSPLYFGEAQNLSDRIPGHEVWPDAVRLGATHIMAHTTPAGEAARLAEERDLIQYYNPPLNKQHRSTG